MSDRHFEDRIVATRIAAVASGMSGGDQQRAEVDQLRNAMPHRQSRRHSELPLND